MLDTLFMIIGIIVVLFVIAGILLVKFGGASVTFKNKETGKERKWGDE